MLKKERRRRSMHMANVSASVSAGELSHRHLEYKHQWQPPSSPSSPSSEPSPVVRLLSSRLQPSPKISLFMASIAVAMAFVAVAAITAVVKPVKCQNHINLNTPPTLFVPDRNWRITETEPVGAIIARIHADDPENDELIFGLEYQLDDTKPFVIDPVLGVVYLNESLIGQGGKNFFLYVTVTDGQLTAKNEVYVNILPASSTNSNNKNHKKMGPHFGSTPPIQNAMNNLTQFLPAFSHLPAVQSIRNQYPNRHPSHILPPNIHPSSIYNFHLSQQRPPWLTNHNNDNDNNNVDNLAENSVEVDQIPELAKITRAPTESFSTTSRTKLTPIKHNNNNNLTSSSSSSSLSTSSAFDILQVNPTETANNYDLTRIVNRSQSSTERNTNGILLSTADNSNVANDLDNGSIGGGDIVSNAMPTLAQYGFKSQILSIVLVVALLFATIVLITAILLFRKRLCAFGKTLKAKSKEELSKKSQQSNHSNSSSNMTDDSHNSMVLQHWHGPMAYGNRYVPWERDQQHQQHQHQQQQQHPEEYQHQHQPQQIRNVNSQPSTSAVNGGSHGTNLSQSCRMNSMATMTIDTTAARTMAPMAYLSNNTPTMNTANKHDNHPQWEFPRHRLKFFNILGEGAFGQVWRCEANDIDGHEGITTVAVKTLKENASEVEKKDLLSELEVMKSLEPHVNVVRLLGCCTEKDPIFVIIEYVNRGKLQTYLRNSRAERHYGNTHGKSNILTSGDLTSFMYQVAKGMDYLTSRGIIHRDLAARNILISDDHTCKVADFGFARDVVTSKIYERKSEGKLPIRWMAIESLYDNIFSTKSDIWSFGILMWEIVTLGSTPYPGISAADVMRKVRGGYRLEKPEHCRRELYNIMYYCWSEDANERPTFSEIVQMLDKLLHTEMDYIELERFPDHNYYNIVHLSGEKV